MAGVGFHFVVGDDDGVAGEAVGQGVHAGFRLCRFVVTGPWERAPLRRFALIWASEVYLLYFM